MVLATTSDFEGTADYTEFTPRASLSWMPNNEHHLYVSFSEGFKGGGFDPRGLTSSAEDLDGARVCEFLDPAGEWHALRHPGVLVS